MANANNNVGNTETSYQLTGLQISRSEENRIESIISELSNGRREPNWEQEKAEIIEADSNQLKSIGDITWDLWINNFSDGKALASEIKTPKPNKDQTMETKRQMLKTIAAYKHLESPTPIVRFVFPFNPYGELESYNWWAPQSIFNVKESDGMLIAQDFWNAIGGEKTMEGLYNFLLGESEGNIDKLKVLAGESTL